MIFYDKNKSLRVLMKELMISGEYFVKRKISKQELDYWNEDAIVKDPDGNIRNLLDPNEIKSRVQNYQYIIEYLKKMKPDSILDLGCGLGDMLLSLDGIKKRTGVDTDIKFAKKRSNKINWIDANVEEYSDEIGSYDAIICHHVIEHLEDPVAFIRRIYKTMKKNSILILGTPDFDCGVARLFDRNYRMLIDPTHTSLFSNDSLSRLLRDTGFQLIDSDYPYFDTTYFNENNLLKMLNRDQLSPPFYGNWFTLFSKKI